MIKEAHLRLVEFELMYVKTIFNLNSNHFVPRLIDNAFIYSSRTK